MTSRRPLLAVPIFLCALFALLLASAPARAAGEPVTLKITHTGAVGVVECSEDGGLTFGECEPEETFEKGTKLTLRGSPGPTVAFVGFSNGTGSAVGCKGPEDCVFTIEEDSSVESSFVPTEKLETQVTGNGKVQCEEVKTGHIGKCSAEYPEGTELTVVGDPEEHWMFTEFGLSTGSAASCSGKTLCTFTITEESAVSVLFQPKPKFALKVNRWGNGTVTSLSPAGIECGGICEAQFEAGPVELLATPGPGYEFVGWIGCPGSEAECELTLGANTEVTAVFLKEAKEGHEGKEGKGGTEGKEGKEGKQGPPGAEGAKGPTGPTGATGPAGEGKEGPKGATGLPGAEGQAGPAGQAGAAGAQGPAGAPGPTGPAGPAGAPGKIELVTCAVVKKKGKSARECTTKLVSGTVKFTATASSAHAALSRHGVVYAVGSAASRRGRVRLRLAALHRLRPGRYKLTIGSGKARHVEAVTLG
jgi:hypothetical protein